MRKIASRLSRIRDRQQGLDRRVLWTSLGELLWAAPALAQGDEAAGLDGRWGGAENGLTAQVIVTGASVIGFFWREDYLDVRDAKFASDSRSLSFAFKGGLATLTRAGKGLATLQVSEGARVTKLSLRRD